MDIPELKTGRQDLVLVAPDVERDAPLAVEWLAGEKGRETLRLMGNTDENNRPSTLAEEQLRIKKFIGATDQQTWMMSWNGQVIGTVWAVLEPTEYLQAPAVHIMIGDPAARGQGLGTAALQSIIDYLRRQGNQEIFSRHLADNMSATRLLQELGFVDSGETYADHDELRWQNMLCRFERS